MEHSVAASGIRLGSGCWGTIRDGKLFPLTGYAKMFPVFWYSARVFLDTVSRSSWPLLQHGS